MAPGPKSARQPITWSHQVTSGSSSNMAAAWIRFSRTERPPRFPVWSRPPGHHLSTGCPTCRCQLLPVSSAPTRPPVCRTRSTTLTRCRRPPTCRATSATEVHRKLIFERWRRRTDIRCRTTWVAACLGTPTAVRARCQPVPGSSRPIEPRTSTAVRLFRWRWTPPPDNRCHHLPSLRRPPPLPSSTHGWLLSVSLYRNSICFLYFNIKFYVRDKFIMLVDS